MNPAIWIHLFILFDKSKLSKAGLVSLILALERKPEIPTITFACLAPLT